MLSITASKIGLLEWWQVIEVIWQFTEESILVITIILITTRIQIILIWSLLFCWWIFPTTATSRITSERLGLD